MATDSPVHTFHIPVMGLSFTIDSPIRVAHYGISSVVSIVDDELIEKMNAFYSKKFCQPYQEISRKFHDYREERIRSYLDLMDHIVKEKFEAFKLELSESRLALERFLGMLPNQSHFKRNLQEILENGCELKHNIKSFLEKHFAPGAIDVNIMTKVDRENHDKNGPLPAEFNDAHTALRGFASSRLQSSIVFSAGMNPRLYSYLESFRCFFPDTEGKLEKKITLKVSDYRSALIQGNFLAKKGLWVSEYRIESGLNCGGHAFATEGFLLGPILEEFRTKRKELIETSHELLLKALDQKEIPAPHQPLALKITVQGGVGTTEEHDFLLQHYEMDSVGWGSPFLLVPEATSVDDETRILLAKAEEKDLYLSHISPLGVPFNTIRDTSNEKLKQHRINAGRPGSSCPKKYLALNKELDNKGLCTASLKYQEQKLESLENRKLELTATAYEQAKFDITEKACLCVGLANASYLEHGITVKGEAQGVVICPGPNMAYFNREVSLHDMVQHIYGYDSVMDFPNRPNLFVKEAQLYVDYLKKEIAIHRSTATPAHFKKWALFQKNLLLGIDYYEELFLSISLGNTINPWSNLRQEIEEIEVGQILDY
ncbi:hypothetical protein [Flavobacterium microcysteis]|uniref:Uncharacterized protein n=1 Tax=Flavobacterium microcysteis TaxID=2596891 RepID=A0A501Q3J4_9FLAO|nr:hypothetical protein [Flavobacterium microcysteis]TPD66938.1 hypothetical protein FJA49_11685 [Flavobacterium microcysteis]